MSTEKRLEDLVHEGKITMEEGFALSSALSRYSAEKQDEMLRPLEKGERSARSLLEELKDHPTGSGFSSQSDEAFQDFKKRIKSFGKEIGAEVENILSDFDKDRFKSNLQDLFEDLTETFKGKQGRSDRVYHEDLHEENLTVLDRLHVQGEARFKQLNVEGSLTVEKNCSMEKLRGKGNVRIKGDLTCKNLDFEGELTVEGNLQTGTAINRGRLICRGDYSTADLDNRSTMNVQGDIQLIRLLNPGNLAADRSIRADRIESSGVLNCLSLIKAGFIEMKEGRVSFMEGDDISLGKNCRVEDLVYRSSLSKEEGARVTHEKKLDS